MVDVVSMCWSEYAHFQKFANSKRLNRKSWGIDEALSELLRKIEENSSDELFAWLTSLAEERSRRLGKPVQLQEGLRNWLKNLATNRSKKYQLTAPHDEAKSKGYCDSASARVETIEQVEIIQSRTNATEWKVLWGIACGEGYENLSQQLTICVNSLKSIVYRCRGRLMKFFSSAA